MARDVKMTVKNNTSKVLKLKGTKVDHGKFTTDPPQEIVSSGYWACSTRTLGTIGPEGTVTYEAEDKSFTVEFYYNHPFGTATSSYSVKPNPRDAIGYDIIGDTKGHDQDITFELFR